MNLPDVDLLIAENKSLQEQLELVRSELTKRIAASERASARQREFLWGLLDALPERIYVKDEAGRFLLVNKAMSEAWGIPIEEFVGKTNVDIFFDQAMMRQLDETDAQVLESLQEVVMSDAMMLDRQGKEVWLSRTKRPIRSLDGQGWNVLGITSDISQIKQHELALMQAWRQTIEVLSNTTEAKDPYTAGHQRRVAQLSAAIGRQLGLDDETQSILSLAGAIHDIGKINIPGEILSKPGKLNLIERRLIETHSTAGYEILKNLILPWPIARIIYQHHERLDGSGYPQRLSGEAIMLEARVIMVADVVESMMSHRPYRMALGQHAALAEIQNGSGMRYDPAVVGACVALFVDQQFAF
jgi:PAS domain S-box-containing protein